MRPIHTILLVVLLSFVAPPATHATPVPDLACDDFTEPAAAQIVLDAWPDTAATLDPDANGIACDAPRSPIGLTLGITDQDNFERTWPPADTSSATDPAIGTIYDLVGDFETVQIVWIDQRPARIQLLPFEESSEDDALDLALAFLPDLTRADVQGTRAQGLTGIVRFTGNSPTLADETDIGWYADLDPSADPGDVSITLYPGAEHIAVIDIALGTGPDPIDE